MHKLLYIIHVLLSQHDAVELEKLSNQWLRVCQQALQDLQQKLQHQVTEDSNHEYNMRKLLQHLNIEPDLVGYSADEDAFQSLL